MAGPVIGVGLDQLEGNLTHRAGEAVADAADAVFGDDEDDE